MEKDYIYFEGKTLTEAYKKAIEHYKCSMNQLQSNVINTSSNGIFGLLKQNARIKVTGVLFDADQTIVNKNVTDKNEKININIKNINNIIKKEHKTNNTKKRKVTNNHNTDNKTLYNDNVITEIKTKINLLFSKLSFDIKEIEVSFYDHQTIFIKFDGADSSLLIGEEANTYKAISYVLFNWINTKYKYMTRLEISNFLKDQERNINKYLESVIKKIRKNGNFKTKTLDSILINIAIIKLRNEFPNKYVGIKTNKENLKYILVNEFKK